MNTDKAFLIGSDVSSSLSPRIHSLFGLKGYGLVDLADGELSEFMSRREFSFVNVTMPHKVRVMDFLDEVSDEAREIGSVNTVVNSGGRLVGYNTDAFGFRKTIDGLGLRSGGKALVFGSGGASRAVRRVLSDIGFDPVVISRSSPTDNYITLRRHCDAVLAVNATPVGGFGHFDENGLLDIGALKRLEAAVDLVYNPPRTRFLLDCASRGVKTACGLRMLVHQAAEAERLALGKDISDGQADDIVTRIADEASCIVLVGMPGAGKSVVGRTVAEATGRKFIDTDVLFEKETGVRPSEFIKRRGERDFRIIEAGIVRKVGESRFSVVATGGGVPENPDSRLHLSSMGCVVWIRRDLRLLDKTERPLSGDIWSLWERRKGIYARCSDFSVDNSRGVAECAGEVIALHREFVSRL